MARLAEHGRDGCGHGAFPVRSRDVHGLEAALGVPEQREELPDVVEAELDPDPLEAIQLLQGPLVVHGSAWREPGPSVKDWLLRGASGAVEPEDRRDRAHEEV